MNKSDKKSDLKKRVISLANKRVQEFAGENVAILQEKITQLCLALDEKKTAQAGKISYQLTHLAPIYHRPDYKNMAEFLCGVLRQDDFKNNDEIYKLFSDNFKQLSSCSEHTPNIEQKILNRTRETLTKYRA